MVASTDTLVKKAVESNVKAQKVGVLLLNLGGPETVEDVRPFLYNLFADPDIIRLPFPMLQRPLASFISSVRSKKSEANYKKIGGGSPIRRITEEQGAKLQEELLKKGFESPKIFIGMRYWHPFTEEAVEAIKAEGVEKLVILPLYPQFSISTSGSSLRLLKQIFEADAELSMLDYTVVPSWHDREGYVQCQVDLIRAELEQFDDPSKPHIVFSAHGVPKSYVEDAGDPYQAQMERCVSSIMRKLNVPNRHTLCFQSRVGPVEWLRPYTEDTIVDLAKRKVEDLVVVPISFVSEHIETLEEIDQEYKELALEAGIKRWRRVPALDTYKPFIADLAALVEEASSSRPISFDEAFEMVRLSREDEPAFGFTPSAEVWNGRLAMVASLLAFWQVLSGHVTITIH